jgi:hypothetical protein
MAADTAECFIAKNGRTTLKHMAAMQSLPSGMALHKSPPHAAET